MSRLSRIIRMSILSMIMAVLSFLGVVRLLQIQVVDANMYSEQVRDTYTATQSIQAVRGRILDSEGRVLNTNETVYKIILQRAFLPFGGENEVIAEILNILIKQDCEWFDNIPVSLKAPFRFKNVGDEELDEFKRRLGLNYDATVENCVKALSVNYKIDAEKYGEQMIRYIGGVRYEMESKDFSFQNRYTLAENISMDVIIELKEKSLVLKGADIVEEPIRVYTDGTKIPHIRGRINAISQEQYAELKDSGYSMNDSIGFFGIEESMESTLCGEKGIREITRDSSWEIISDEITKPIKPGNTVKLTIDTEFQETVDDILKNTIKWVNQLDRYPNRNVKTEVKGGSIVVLDVTNGDILAMSTYPTYDLEDHVDIMLAESAGEPPFPNKPLLNRAAANDYRPGSTFKTVTATSGLMNGVIGRNDRVYCGGRYYYFSDYHPGCTGTHGSSNVVHALNMSCNVFFYDVGRRLGKENLAETALKYGVGTDLDCGIRMVSGRMTTPENYEELNGTPMGDGDLIQAAIGQSENRLTPLHMATIAMTIANNGVRYRPHLVKSVWNYEATECLYETPVEIAEDFSEGNEETFKIVREGMYALAKRNNNLFVNLPDLPCYKTGTPEIISGKLYDSACLGFYPSQNPKIAFAVILEGGEYSTRAIRNVIDAYFYGHYKPKIDDKGNVANYWEPWEKPFPTPIPGRYIEDDGESEE